jgi:hypothetical protein
VYLARGLEALTLHDLREYIDRKEEAGMDVEIFGAKLPVDILCGWGIQLLVVMRLYFWLHMRFFASRKTMRPPVGQLPWIGLYPDTLSSAGRRTRCHG